MGRGDYQRLNLRYQELEGKGTKKMAGKTKISKCRLYADVTEISLLHQYHISEIYDIFKHGI